MVCAAALERRAAAAGSVQTQVMVMPAEEELDAPSPVEAVAEGAANVFTSLTANLKNLVGGGSS